ncbi:MAG TPA: hypothetical protein VJ890_00745, partial [Vineibacter sp.]|nr:hypothetical protein [Vineibacter sp.]
KDLSGAGAVVEISGIGELKVHDGLLRKQDTVAKSLAKGKSKGKSKAKGAALPVEPEPYTNALLVHARAVKSAALQDAVVRAAAADDGDAAMCLAIVGLLGCGAKIKMRDDMRTGFDPGRGAGQAVRMQALWAEILSGSDPAVTGKRLRRDDDVNTTAMRRNAETLAKGDTSIHAPWYDGPPPHAVWTWLQSLDRGRRVQIFATLVADRCGYFLAYQKPAPHHDAFDVAVAQHIGLDMTRKWTPDDTWIDGSRKARLEVLARAIALDPIPKSTTQLRAALKARLADPSPLPPAATWFPSEVRILDEASFKAVFHSPGARHSSDASDDAPTEDARQESRGPSS